MVNFPALTPKGRLTRELYAARTHGRAPGWPIVTSRGTIISYRWNTCLPRLAQMSPRQLPVSSTRRASTRTVSIRGLLAADEAEDHRVLAFDGIDAIPAGVIVRAGNGNQRRYNAGRFCVILTMPFLGKHHSFTSPYFSAAACRARNAQHSGAPRVGGSSAQPLSSTLILARRGSRHVIGGGPCDRATEAVDARLIGRSFYQLHGRASFANISPATRRSCSVIALAMGSPGANLNHYRPNDPSAATPGARPLR